MSTKKLYLKKNDLQPYYYAKVKDSDGAAISLVGATIYCTMKLLSGAIKINRQTAGVNITDESAGEFEYQWQSGDTDTAGVYAIEFEINPAAGGKFTVPVDSDDKAIVVIRDSLDKV